MALISRALLAALLIIMARKKSNIFDSFLNACVHGNVSNKNNARAIIEAGASQLISKPLRSGISQLISRGSGYSACGGKPWGEQEEELGEADTKNHIEES